MTRDGERWLVVWEQTATVEVRAAAPANALLLRLECGLAGAWTELAQGREIIRFGYPENSKSPWFRIHRAPRGGHNVLTLALERIIFARGVGGVAVMENSLAAVCRCALRPHRDAVALRVREAGQTPTEFLHTLDPGSLATE